MMYFNVFYHKSAKFLHNFCATVSIYFIYCSKLANRFVQAIELYANSAVPKRQTSITDNYDEQLQCTVHSLLNM